MSKKRLTETIKSVAIILLIFSAGFLASATGLFTDLFVNLPLFNIIEGSGSNTDLQPGSADSYQQAALPTAMAVRGTSGLRYGVEYNSRNIEDLYNNFKTELGEALGSASIPEKTNENEWRDALTGQGVYFDYGTAIPLDALARWLGTALINDSGNSARRLVIKSCGDNGVALYCMDGEGNTWRCETKAAWSGIADELDAYLPNGAMFAYEKTALSDAEPYNLILNELPELYKLNASGSAFNINSNTAETASELLGVSMYGDSSYRESDGTVVYLDDSGTVKLRADGYLSYNASDEGGLTEADNIADMVEASRSILSEIHETFSGDEKLLLTDISEEADTCTISFGYFVEGAEVKYGSRSAGAALFKDKSLIQLEIKIRSYKINDEKAQLLPEYQAAAIAADMSKGSEVKLIWPDSGRGTADISPKWNVY
jgi:hypothetical protein